MKPVKNYNRNVKLFFLVEVLGILLAFFGDAKLAGIGILMSLFGIVMLLYLKYSTAKLVPAKYRRSAYIFLFYEFIMLGIFLAALIAIVPMLLL